MSSTKIAVITGGNRGLGKAEAQAIAKNGINPIITYRSHASEAAELVKELTSSGVKAVAMQLDLTDSKNFPNFADNLKEILSKEFKRNNFDYLINNGGVGINTPIGATKEEDIDILFQIHFKGVVLLTQNLLPLIADNGKIINTSSGLARFSLGEYSIYGALKGAIDVYTRYLANAVAERGITANTVAPGAIATDFGGAAMKNPKIAEITGSTAAMKRVGEPEEIGDLVALMLSDGFGWVTGQRIEASGGTLL